VLDAPQLCAEYHGAYAHSRGWETSSSWELRPHGEVARQAPRLQRGQLAEDSRLHRRPVCRQWQVSGYCEGSQ
jgi:hypothetical protein